MNVHHTDRWWKGISAERCTCRSRPNNRSAPRARSHSCATGSIAAGGRRERRHVLPSSVAAVLDGWDGERLRVLVTNGSGPFGPRSEIAGAVLPWSEVVTLAPVPMGLYERSCGACRAGRAGSRWSSSLRTRSASTAARLRSTSPRTCSGQAANRSSARARSSRGRSIGALSGQERTCSRPRTSTRAIRAHEHVTVLVR